MRQPGCLIVSLSLWPWLPHSFQDRCLIVSLSLWPWLPHSFQDRCLIVSLSLWPWLPHSSQGRCLIVSLSLWPWLTAPRTVVSLSHCLVGLAPSQLPGPLSHCLSVSLALAPSQLPGPLSHCLIGLAPAQLPGSLSHCLIVSLASLTAPRTVVSLSLWPWLTAPRTVVSLSLCLPAFCARRRKRKPGFSQSYLVLLRRPTVAFEKHCTLGFFGHGGVQRNRQASGLHCSEPLLEESLAERHLDLHRRALQPPHGPAS